MKPALKPTTVISNSCTMLEELKRRCDKSHVHQSLVGGRASAAENYPIDLIMAIIRGMAKTNQAMAHAHDNGTAHRENVLSMNACNPPEPTDATQIVDVPAPKLISKDGKPFGIDFNDEHFKKDIQRRMHG